MTDPSASVRRASGRTARRPAGNVRGSVTPSGTRSDRQATAVHDPDKRWRLVNSAAAAFSRQGFERAGVDEIAAAADVAKGTVYLYFHDKADLFLAVLAELPDRLQLRSKAREDLDPELALRELIRTHLEVAHEAPDLFRCYLSALFGVNRDFQNAALEVFAAQRALVVDFLRRLPGGPRGSRAIEHRASLFVGAILAGALIDNLDRGSRRVRGHEDAFMALLREPVA